MKTIDSRKTYIHSTEPLILGSTTNAESVVNVCNLQRKLVKMIKVGNTSLTLSGTLLVLVDTFYPLSPCTSVQGCVSGESARLGRLTSSFIPRDELLELANKVTLGR